MVKELIRRVRICSGAKRGELARIPARYDRSGSGAALSELCRMA